MGWGMKKKAHGVSVQWSYGGDYVIEIPPSKVTKVSCQMCRWYDIEDHSCAPRSLGPKDHLDHWKKCQEFILDPDYIGQDVLNRIKTVRGKHFLEEMMEKSKALIVQQEVKKIPSKQKEKIKANEGGNASEIVSSMVLEENNTTLEGQLYLYKKRERCVILSENQKYYVLKFESGRECQYDKKTLIINHWLTKL